MKGAVLALHWSAPSHQHSARRSDRHGGTTAYADIGPLGADKGKGGKFLVVPPGFQGNIPDGYFVSKS